MGVVDKIRIRGRPALPHTLRQILAECERKVLTELGNERFERARERGQSMEIEQAVEFASQYGGSIGPAPSTRRGRPDEASALHSGLSRRELEVAALVAKGMSNKRNRGQADPLRAHHRSPRGPHSRQAWLQFTRAGRRLGCGERGTVLTHRDPMGSLADLVAASRTLPSSQLAHGRSRR